MESPNSPNNPSPTAVSGRRISPHTLPATRSDPNNPYPTTFVQADTSSFKQVVQMLTGSSETARLASRSGPPARPGPRKDRSASKLYERRSGAALKSFKISPLRAGFIPQYMGSTRPATPEALSPSILDFPSLALSPVTPLIPDPFKPDLAAEDWAIREKGFYLHPSPARDSEPRLLPLFPVTSPRVAES